MITASSGGPTLRLRTFGGLSLERDGVPVTGAGGRRRPLAVLAQLAVAGERGVSRARLLLRLWPDSDEEKARNVLAQTLHGLRRDLQADDLVLGTVELRLNPAVIGCDVAEFEAALAGHDAARAAAVYRGPFLDGFYLNDVPEFERWVEEERSSLAHRAAGALERLAGTAAAAGDHAQAADLWRRLAAMDALNSRVTVGLMRALAAVGDPAGALQAARVHEALLLAELGTRPDAAVSALVESLRRAPTSPVAAAPPPVSHLPTSPPSPELHPSPAPAPTSVRTPAESSTGGPHRRRRAWMAAAAAGTCSAILIATIVLPRFRSPAHAAIGPQRVLVATFENNTGDRSLDLVGRMAADWITQRLAETQLLEVVDTRTALLTQSSLAADTGVMHGLRGVRALAAETGARTVVWGSYYRDGDSLYFQAQLLDPVRGTVVRTLEPVSSAVATPLAGVERLRERVTGALALEYNPRLSEWIGHATRPPTYAAYQEFMAGVDLTTSGDARQAVPHFRRAFGLDTTYLQALLWAVDNEYAVSEFHEADSLLRIVVAARQRLAPFDQRLADYYVASLAGDYAGALDAGRQMVALAPGAESYMVVAEEGLHSRQLDVALDAIGKVDPDRGWLRGWAAYWQWLAYMRHLAGDIDGERAAVREGLRRHPGSIDVVSSAAVVEAALGHYAAAEAATDHALRLEPDGELTPSRVLCIVADEMQAHGHPDQARRLLDHGLAWLASLPDSLKQAKGVRYDRARALYESGRLESARAIADSLLREYPASTEYLTMTGAIAAREGRRGDAERVSAKLAGMRAPYQYGEPTFGRARLAALLGRRGDALALVRQAFSEGKPYNDTVHREYDLESLRGADPFLQLTLPAANRH